MIQLLALRFGQIRSFVDDQEIVFANREKLIQIDGKNLNTGGSSGSGKSTVLMVLDYLLGLNDVPATLLQSRLTKSGMWAEGDFVIDGQPVTISRSKKDGLSITMGDNKVSGNSDQAEEKLQELIGLPMPIFKKMIHKRQKEGGFFLGLGASKTYKFLVSVLGLEKHITDIDAIVADIKRWDEEATAAQRTLDLDRSSLLDLERILSEKQKPVQNYSDEQIEQMNKDVQGLQITLRALKMQVKEDVAEVPVVVDKTIDATELNQKISALVPRRNELNGFIKDLENVKVNLQAEINKIPFYLADAQKAGKRISDLRAEMAHIEQSQCPKCMQNWVGDSAKASIESIKGEIDQKISEALALKSKIDTKPDLESKLLTVINEIATHNQELIQLQEQRAGYDATKYAMMEAVGSENAIARQKYNEKIKTIEVNSQKNIDAINQKLKDAEIALNGEEIKRNSYLIAMRSYEKDVEALQGSITRKQNEIQNSTTKLNDLGKKLVVAKESQRLIKAYVLQTFQDTLDAIGETATNILSAIPNMNTSTIYFENCKETKTGSIKDEITAIINIDGNNDIPINSLSGGEKTAIDLRADLAFIDVIEQKVAKGANFFFMDEPFDGLDSVCKENCLEILKQVDTNKKIIMVDHSSELKEMVSDVILVVKNGESSSIAS